MSFLRCFVCLILPALASWCAAADRPHIIFILADDLGYNDLGCYGQKRLTTPHIDRLAAEGIKFTRHYAGSTVCAPSRCVLMTGLHTGHCAVRGNGPGLIPDETMTVPKLLKSAGYATACIGKYGLGLPLPPDDPQKKGFDYFFGYVGTSHAHNCYTTFLTRNGERVPLQNTPIEGTEKKAMEGTGVAGAEGRVEFAPALMAADVQKYLETQGRGEKPFFLYYSLNLPHANNEAGKDAPLGHGMESPGYGEYADKDWPAAEKGFASVMRFVDNEVGAVMDKVKALGIDQNTLIIFSSDNGPHREGLHDADFFDSNGALNGIKRDLTDGGIRVPFVVRWPAKIKGGGISDHVSGFQDFLPTVAELSGAKLAGECDGLSMVASMKGQGLQLQHPFLFWNFDEQGGKRALLQWPWKLVHLHTNGGRNKSGGGPARPLQVHLYNLESDPGEARNAASENPALVSQLQTLMEGTWRAPAQP